MKCLNFIFVGVLVVLFLSCHSDNDMILGGDESCSPSFVIKLNDFTFKCMVVDSCETCGVISILDRENNYMDDYVKNVKQQNGKILSTCKDELICTITQDKDEIYIVKISDNIHDRFSKIEVSWSRLDMKTAIARIYYENGTWNCDGFFAAEEEKYQ